MIAKHATATHHSLLAGISFCFPTINYAQSDFDQRPYGFRSAQIAVLPLSPVIDTSQ